MTDLDLAFHGVGTGHETWLQVHDTCRLLEAVKDPKQQGRIRSWQVLALVMGELSKHAAPDSVDYRYWRMTAQKLNLALVRTNRNNFLIPGAYDADHQDSWLPADLLKAGGAG